MRIKSQLNILPIGCALRLIEKQVRDLRCPAAVMWSQPHNVTGKLGRRGRRGSRARRTARSERCIVPARDRKARLFLCVFSMPFCRRSKKVFYLHGVCTSLCAIFRSCLDAAIMLAFWKQNMSVELCRARTLFLWCMYGLYLVKGEAVNEKEDS